jgi:hypothetical protein
MFFPFFPFPFDFSGKKLFKKAKYPDDLMCIFKILSVWLVFLTVSLFFQTRTQGVWVWGLNFNS